VLLEQFEGLRRPTSRICCANFRRSGASRSRSRSTTSGSPMSCRSCPMTIRSICSEHLEVRRAADVWRDGSRRRRRPARRTADRRARIAARPDGSAESEPVPPTAPALPRYRWRSDDPKPVILTPATTVAEALARVRNPDLTPAPGLDGFRGPPAAATPTAATSDRSICSDCCGTAGPPGRRHPRQQSGPTAVPTFRSAR